MSPMYFIWIIIAVVFYGIVDAIIRSKSNKIANAKTAKEAIEERKSLKRFLRSYPIFGLFTGTIQTNYQEVQDQVSDETIDSFFSRTRQYALYLRAFHNDNYLSQDEPKGFLGNNLEDTPKDYGSFSEKAFTDEMEQFISTNAVGMTREVIHPEGARRIYLDDDTWQEDVALLMEQASVIIVLMERRESCLWEYQQSLTMREKTYYLIDDLRDYYDINAHEKMSLPVIPTCFSKANHLVFHWQEGKYYAQPYSNTKNDYKYLANFMNGQEEDYVREELLMGIYDGLERIWISADDTDEDIRARLLKRIQMKQQVCPLMFGEMALTDCDLVDNKVIFRFSGDDMDESLAEMSHDALSNELMMPEHQQFLDVVEALQLEVCHVFTDDKGWQSEYIF